MRVAGEVDELQVSQLVEAEAVGVGDLHHDRIAIGRLPALASRPPHAFDLIVGVDEESIELGPRVGTLRGSAVVLLDVRCGVPVEEDLRRVGAEVLLADPVPSVVGVADVARERPKRRVVAAQRGARDVSDGAQVGRELLDHRRRPVPRILVHVLNEPAHTAQPLLDRRELQVPGELLVAPAVEHHLEHLLVGPEDRHRLHQVDPSRAVNLHRNSRDPGYIQ